MENAALAVTAAESLSRRGCRIGASDIITGISEVRWPARMQVLQRSPLVIIDGAHNAYSMNTLIASLRGYFTFARAVVIFGCSRDKDIAGMAAELKGFADHVILATSSHARAAGTDELARIFSACGLEAVTGGSTAEAVALAKGMAGKEDLILATGSLFVAAEAGRTFQDSGKTV
jgi:dihydrofolate synthase/folylpolyglutamate synthase